MNPVIRFSLLIGEGQEVTGSDGNKYSSGSGWIDVTGGMSSWADTEVSRQRDGLTAVITEVASPVVFDDCRALPGDFSAYVLVKRLFEKYGLHASARMRVEKRDDVDLDAYTVLHEFDLDFQHYEWQDGRVTLEGTSPTLQQAIKSRGGTKYDIPVSEVRDSTQFKYTPLKIESTAKYEMPIEPDINLAKNGGAGYLFYQITHIETETVDDKSIVLSRSQGVKITDEDGFDYGNYFLEAVEDVTVSLKIKFSTWATLTDKAGTPVVGDANMYVFLMLNNGKYLEQLQLTRVDSRYSGDFVYDEAVPLRKGERLYVVLGYENASGQGSRINAGVSKPNFTVSWVQTSGTVSYIDVIKPDELLQAVLDRIGDGFVGEMPELDYGYGCVSMLCAAESIRDLADANIHVSLDDIIKWLEVKGYTYNIDGNTLVFASMWEYFDKSKTAIALSEASDVKIEASGDYAYTSVKIGYKKQEYDNINGRYEVNGTFEYTTGYTSNEDNVLELISPFRADNYGIEFLTWERWKTTEDDQSDNDVFEVVVKLNGTSGFYEFKGTSQYTQKFGSESELGITFYNADLCPKALLMKNLGRLGIVSAKLSFSSTTNSRFAYIDGFEWPFDDVFTGGRRLFSPFLYKITVGLVESTDIADYGGIITFKCIDENGDFHTKRGFLKEANRSVLKEKAEEWTLFAIEDGEEGG